MRNRQTHRRAVCAVLLLAVAALTTPAADGARAQSLADALAHTYEDNPTLLAARASLRATDELLPQAKSNFWRPSVSLSFTEGRSWITSQDKETSARLGRRTETTDTTQTDRKFGWDVELPIYRGGQTTAEIEQAEGEIDAAEASLISTEQQVFQNAVTAYSNVVFYTAVRGIIEDDISDLQQIETAIRELVQAQRRTVTDLAQVQDSLAQARVRLASNQGNLAGAINDYIAIVGVAPFNLEQWPSLAQLPESRDRAVELAQALDPALVQARGNLRSAEASIDAAVGVLLPQVSVYQSYTHEREKSQYSGGLNPYDELDSEDTISIGVEVTVQLYQGGYNYSNVREARQQAAQARQDVSAARRQAISDAGTAWDQLIAVREEAAINQDRLAVARQAEDGLRFQVRRGLASVQDFISVRESRLAAESAIQSSSRNVLLSEATLLAATGQLTAAALELPVAFYDPKAYLSSFTVKE